MSSICLNCVLFTIKGREVKDNKYVPIFQMWLGQLICSGGLSAADAIYFYTDADTLEYLKQTIVFVNLTLKIPCQLRLFVMSQRPASYVEGVMWRFIPNDYSQDVFMYCDIDILFNKSIHLITDAMKDNTICIHREGDITNHEYGNAFKKEELEKLGVGCPGFSAGKFLIKGKTLYKKLLDIAHAIRVEVEYNKIPDINDQHIFNKTIYCLNMNEHTIDFTTLNPPIISTNGFNFQKDLTILLDLMGMYGDGDFHYKKMRDMFILLRCNAF